MPEYTPEDKKRKEEDKKRQERAKAGAPLVKGVQGRQQALMNMAARAREVAEYKTRLRAENSNKGKPYGNIVTPGTVTGSTGKEKKFGVTEKRVTGANMRALQMLRESAAKGNRNSKDKLNRPRFSTGGSGSGMNVNFGEQIK
jgi:hypothetical protein